jgi:hypothetical protein
MNAAEIVTSRLIGSVFVERGLLSESQIRVALEIQRESGQQLGQILVERFGVSRHELASVVAEQWAEIGQSAPRETDGASNESWRRLGEIFVERGFVTAEQLEQALARQRETGERVGEALVAQGSISKFELAGALAEQLSTLEEGGASGTEPSGAKVVSIAPRLEEPAPPVGASLESGDPETGEPERWEPERHGPEPRSAFGVVAFASTPAGYRLVALDGPVPSIGDIVELSEVGELVALRLGPSPLPDDARTCVYLEQPVRSETAALP